MTYLGPAYGPAFDRQEAQRKAIRELYAFAVNLLIAGAAAVFALVWVGIWITRP